MLRDRANQAALDESQQSAPHAALHDGDREVTTGDEAIDDNDTDEDDAIWDDFYVDPYSQQFLTMESTIASANEASAAGSAVSRNGNAVPHPVFQKLPGITERIDATTKLDFPLPLPFARPAASGGNEPELTQQLPLAQTPVKETERWKPPESWIVGNADNIPSAAGSSDASSTVVIQKAIKSGAEVVCRG